jgi:hypothetical protein
MNPMRTAYLAAVSARWSGAQLRDARANWRMFEERREELEALVTAYRRDNWQKDLAGKCHNSPGSLAGMCWLYAGNAPDFLYVDFEEHFQTFFLRRGILAYLKLLCEAREAAAAAPEPTLPLPFGLTPAA